MKTSYDWIQAVKPALAVSSDYAIADKLGVSRQFISNVKKGRSHLTKVMAEQVAEALNIEFAEVWLTIEAEKEKDAKIRTSYQHILDRLGSVAASVFALNTVAYMIQDKGPAFLANAHQYILCKIADPSGQLPLFSDNCQKPGYSAQSSAKRPPITVLERAYLPINNNYNLSVTSK